MKYHKQRIVVKFDEEGKLISKKGSCFPTVLACLLDLELDQVPNINTLFWDDHEKMNLVKHSEQGELEPSLSLWYTVINVWLLSQGYAERRWSAPFKTDFEKEVLKNHPDIPYMVSGVSPRGVLHVVIYQNGEMIHDPHPDGNGLVEITEYSALLNLETNQYGK